MGKINNLFKIISPWATLTIGEPERGVGGQRKKIKINPAEKGNKKVH